MNGTHHKIIGSFAVITFVLLVAAVTLTIFGQHMSITLAIVEDLDEVRDGLKNFISLSSEFKVLDTFKTAEEAFMKFPS